MPCATCHRLQGPRGPHPGGVRSQADARSFLPCWQWPHCIPCYVRVLSHSLSSDLALRCLLDRVEGDDECGEPRRKRVKQEGGAKRDEVSGLAVALCCHHRCDWRHYVGKEFFRERGLGACEFAAFQRMSSWATCGLRKVAGVEGRSSAGEWATEEHEQGEDAVPSTLNEWVCFTYDWQTPLSHPRTRTVTQKDQHICYATGLQNRCPDSL